MKNLFHCLALSGLFLFLCDHGDLRRALKTLKPRFNSILLSDSNAKRLLFIWKVREVNERILRSSFHKKRLTDQKKRRKERKMRRRREQNANGSKKMRRENEEMLMAMKDWKTMTSFVSFSELSSIPPSDSILTNREYSPSNQSNLEEKKKRKIKTEQHLSPETKGRMSAFRPPLSDNVFAGDRSTQLASSSCSPRLLLVSLSRNVGFLSRESMRRNKKKVSSE